MKDDRLYLIHIRECIERVCANRGEEYVDEETAARLPQAAEEAARSGVQVDIREYVAA